MLTTDKTIVFCIGAQKAGTSWLYTVLSAHPQCHLQSKEIHYFDAALDPDRASGVLRRRTEKLTRVLARAASEKQLKTDDRGIAGMRDRIALLEQVVANTGDDDAYLSFLLNGADALPVVGDITPAYALLGKKEFARMAALSPNCRFLFLMRDPIDRLWSDLRMRAEVTQKRQGGNRAKADEEEYEKICLRKLDSLINGEPMDGPHRSNYSLTVKELEASVPADQIMTVFFEDMFEQASIDRMCKFIGIAPVQAEVEAVKFPGRKLAFPQDRFAKVYSWLADQYEWAATRFPDGLPARWRDRITQGQANG